jgi:hypothetical protein
VRATEDGASLCVLITLPQSPNQRANRTAEFRTFEAKAASFRVLSDESRKSATDSRKAVSVRLKESNIATVNSRLGKFGFEALCNLVKAFSGGAITNEHLVAGLADAVADRIAKIGSDKN